MLIKKAKLLTRCISLCTIFLFGKVSYSQETCATAIPISISNNGFGTGSFISAHIDLSGATTEAGESFDPALASLGLNQKTIWYRFTLPTTRNVSVTIAQPSVIIANGDVGITIYKTGNCLPATGDISTKLTPRAFFGSTSNLCIEGGTYLIQVAARNSANGHVFIQLDISDLTGG